MNRWEPRTERDLSDAIAAQTLEESHYLDVKREVGSGSAANKELARDLASFALDSGALLVGIEEDKRARTWALYPTPLSGLAERIEQVAQQLIDPPLYVVPRLIESSADPTRGYAFVEVPSSAVSPHMVEGIYYGRGDTTRIRLSDAEVLRHHARRASVEAVADGLLDEELAREPIVEGDRRHGHLYLVAHAITGHSALAQDLVRTQNADLYELIQEVEDRLPGDIRDYAPSASRATSRSRRAAGTALSSGGGLVAGRSWSAEREGYSDESNLVDIEFREDGGIRVLVGRMTDEWALGGRSTGVILDGLAIAYVLRLISWSAAVAGRTGYRGSWTLGLHADRLRGLQSHRTAEGLSTDLQKYDAECYRGRTTATLLELKEEPQQVAQRIVGRLVRGLGTWSYYRQYLEVPGRASIPGG